MRASGESMCFCRRRDPVDDTLAARVAAAGALRPQEAEVGREPSIANAALHPAGTFAVELKPYGAAADSCPHCEPAVVISRLDATRSGPSWAAGPSPRATTSPVWRELLAEKQECRPEDLQ
jgi:hypothetical protein